MTHSHLQWAICLLFVLSAVAPVNADWTLREKQPLPEIAQQLDSMGIGIAVFDPCANRPASGDFSA